MNQTTIIVLLVMGVLVMHAETLCARAERQRIQYEPTWESLKQHETPQWFMDAKLGLFIYPPEPNPEQWAATGKRGGTPRSGEAWDTYEWDPESYAQLAVDMGARYVVYNPDPRSVFSTWPSRYDDIEGSPFHYVRGPVENKKDYVGELAAAVRARGLKFGFHINCLNSEGWPLWLDRAKELIDLYHPDNLRLDQEAHYIPAERLRSLELLAYFYNTAEDPSQVAMEDSLGSHKHGVGRKRTWGTALEEVGDFYRKEQSSPHDEISDGYFMRYEQLFRRRHRSPVNESEGLVNNLIEWLADAVSKNGNLDISILPGPPDLYPFERRTLRQIGPWLEVNGEAIYATRPWRDGKPQSQTTSGIHVRYTTRGDSLYAILFKWPQGKPVLPNLRAVEGTRVRMLGVKAEIPWGQIDHSLQLNLPPATHGEGYEIEIPCDHAFVYKITPRPEWIP